MDEKRGVRTIRRAAALALAAASALHALSWVRPLDARNLFQLEFALHPYEASATLVAPLGEEGIPSLDANAEEGLFYSETFRQLALPNFWSIGVDVKPVAVAGVVVRENFPEAFDAAEIRPGVNAIRIVTDGFPDPGALVLGAGSEINVVDADGRIVGRCHGGFALASGFGHIVSNSIFADLWTEPSFRIKGEIVLEWMAEHDKRGIEDFVASLPPYVMAKAKVSVEGLDVDAVFAALKKAWPDAEMSELDGLKLDMPEGWVHVRKSNTEPIVRVMTESAIPGKADELAKRAGDIISSLA